MRQIQEPCRESLQQALLIIEEYLEDSLSGICVIGSSTCSDWEEESDIDILLITRERLDYHITFEIEDLLEDRVEVRVQLILMDIEVLLEYHLKNRTTMAHSIRRGVVIDDRDGYFQPFLQLTDKDLPEVEWIKEYYLRFVSCHTLGLRNIGEDSYGSFEEESIPFYPNDLCRAIVNYSILYLELKGIIPTTKKQIIRGLYRVHFPLQKITHIKRSLAIRREGRLLFKEELYTFAPTAEYLKDTIQSLLGVDDEVLKPYTLFLRR